MAKLILTSYGFNTKVGRKLISRELKKDANLGDKKIFLFHEPYFSIEELLKTVCMELGFKRENIFFVGDSGSICRVREADYIYVTEGNTFEILSLIRKRGLEELIKEAVKAGATYIGASAGAMLAGVDIAEASCMDRNFSNLQNLAAFGFFNGIILPHYTPKERERYIANSPGITEKYNAIYSVANDGILVLEV